GIPAGGGCAMKNRRFTTTRKRKPEPINCHTLAIGTCLKQTRDRKKLPDGRKYTQDMLAADAGISRAKLARIEAGVSKVSIPEWDRLRKALHPLLPKLDAIIPLAAFAVAVARPSESPLVIQQALDAFKLASHAKKENESGASSVPGGVA